MRSCMALLLFAAACGEVTAPLPPLPTEAREVTAGGGRVRGATFTLDVQLGHPLRQGRVSGPTYALEGNAAVRP
jgi:hypothetical protein